MLSRIDPLFKSLFRRAEQTDTRQAIRREETTAHRRKKEDEEKRQAMADAVTDESEVSIKSLISFLYDLLRQDTQSAQEQSFSSMAENMTEPEMETDAPHSEWENSPSTPASQAASAYQTTATKIEAPNYSEGNSISPEDSAHIVALDSKDRKTLEGFVTELSQLDAQGVETLNISRAGTFFESLREAIDTQKSS